MERRTVFCDSAAGISPNNRRWPS